jgi:hypothetical protein
MQLDPSEAVTPVGALGTLARKPLSPLLNPLAPQLFVALTQYQ